MKPQESVKYYNFDILRKIGWQKLKFLEAY